MEQQQVLEGNTDDPIAFKMAIEAIEDVVKKLKLRVDISYKAGHVSKYHQKWVIKTMGHTFFDKSFVVAAQQAMELILKAKL